MLAGVLRGNITNPAKWHDSFKVGLGLDLSSGTTITLQAVTKNHATPNQGQMTEARNIMLQRVDGAGFSGAIVQQQGNQFLTVSVPGQGAEKVANIVGQTALLRFRQVLLCSGISTQCLGRLAEGGQPDGRLVGLAEPVAVRLDLAQPDDLADQSSSAPRRLSSSSKGVGPGGRGDQARGLLLAEGVHLGQASSSAKASSSASPSSSASASPSPSASASRRLGGHRRRRARSTRRRWPCSTS